MCVCVCVCVCAYAMGVKKTTNESVYIEILKKTFQLVGNKLQSEKVKYLQHDAIMA